MTMGILGAMGIVRNTDQHLLVRTLEMAVRRMGLSARGHDRILRMARTIADLDRAEHVSAKHLTEAVQYRSLDRIYLN